MAQDNRRLQLDLRDLPEGIKPTLRAEAFKNGISLSKVCRAVLVRHALKTGETDFGPPPHDEIPFAEVLDGD